MRDTLNDTPCVGHSAVDHLKYCKFRRLPTSLIMLSGIDFLAVLKLELLRSLNMLSKERERDHHFTPLIKLYVRTCNLCVLVIR